MSNEAKGKLPNRPVVREELNTPGLHDLSHERDKRCVPVAHKIIKSLANMEEMPVGSHVPEEKSALYVPVIYSVLKDMIENDLKVSDATYTIALAMQGLEAIKTGIDETLNQNMNRVTELIYDLPLNDFNEVTIKKLNQVVQRKEKLSEVIKPVIDDSSLDIPLE